MSDLIERLRGQANCESPPVDDLLREAADALEAARADAERYRWLRSRVDWKRPGDELPWTTPSGVYLVATMVSGAYGNCDDQTNAAIDAAMAAEGRE